MPDEFVPQEILVITDASYQTDPRPRPRRGSHGPRVPNLESIDIGNLQGQVNIFLQQMDQMMTETPEKVGQFRLDEFEVAVGIVVEAKGSVKLALFANAEAGGSINASMKFVFKRG